MNKKQLKYVLRCKECNKEFVDLELAFKHEDFEGMFDISSFHIVRKEPENE